MMRGWKVLAVVAVVALCSATLGMAGAGEKKAREKSKVKPKRVFHVVAFKFKDDATKEQIDKVCRDFRNLKKKMSIAHFSAASKIVTWDTQRTSTFVGMPLQGA